MRGIGVGRKARRHSDFPRHVSYGFDLSFKAVIRQLALKICMAAEELLGRRALTPGSPVGALDALCPKSCRD